jgi:hypothetical protein
MRPGVTHELLNCSEHPYNSQQRPKNNSLVHSKFITTAHASALSPTCATFLAKHHIPQMCHTHITQQFPHVTFCVAN